MVQKNKLGKGLSSQSKFANMVLITTLLNQTSIMKTRLKGLYESFAVNGIEL